MRAIRLCTEIVITDPAKTATTTSTLFLGSIVIIADLT